MSEGYDVGVIGAGYVGLTTGACLAHLGHRVTCVDKDAHLIAELEEGRLPFYEPGLEELMAKSAGRLHFTAELSSVVRDADVVFIVVDTPQAEDGSANLSNVASVSQSIGRALAKPGATFREHPLVVVNKSTVPVGSGDYVSMLIREGIAEGGAEGVSSGGDGGSGVSYRVVSNPEFLREGSAVY